MPTVYRLSGENANFLGGWRCGRTRTRTGSVHRLAATSSARGQGQSHRLDQGQTDLRPAASSALRLVRASLAGLVTQ